MKDNASKETASVILGFPYRRSFNRLTTKPIVLTGSIFPFFFLVLLLLFFLVYSDATFYTANSR